MTTTYLVALVSSFFLGYLLNVRRSYSKGYLEGAEKTAEEFARQLAEHYYIIKKEDIDNGNS